MGLPFDALLSGALYLKVSWKKDFKRARLPAIIERGRGNAKKGGKKESREITEQSFKTKRQRKVHYTLDPCSMMPSG